MSAPDDHFTAGPDCRVTVLGQSGALVVLVAVQLSVSGLYLPPVFKVLLTIISAPDDHFTAGPHCRVKCLGQSGALVVLVAVQLSVLGLYLPPVFRYSAAISSAPDDHFTAGPHCRVIASGSGRVGSAGSCPTIGARIVSSAGVKCCHVPPQTIISVPVHTAVCPVSASGRVGGAGGCPTVGAGIVSAAGVQEAVVISSAPDNHFTASPDCRVRGSGSQARWWCW